MSFKRFKKAFTLVELIIGLALMGIITSFSTASYVGYKQSADENKATLDVQSVKNAVDNFRDANGKYPTSPIEKQPSPDVVDSSGNVTFEGYSKIDIERLVSERYLQAAPKLKNGQYFAVNYNGVVTIREDFSESVIIENGEMIIPTQKNDLLTFDVYTGLDCSSVKVFETKKDYVVSSSGVTFTSSNLIDKTNEYEYYSREIQVSNSQGEKYFIVRITYKNGKTVDLRAAVTYAVSADNVAGDPYWVNPSGNQSTDALKKSPITMTDSCITNKDSAITLNWSTYQLASGSAAVKYEIEKYIKDGSTLTPAPDSPIVTGSTEYVDTAVRSDKTYEYRVYAYTASTSNGVNKKTINYLVKSGLKPTAYTDTMSYIDNITKNDFNTAYNKDVSVRVGDVDNGVMSVSLYVARVEDGAIAGDFRRYEMNKTKDGTSTVNSAGKKIVTDVYSVPIEIKDDYMIYYIKVIDNKGYETYCYMNPSLQKGDNETDTAFELRRQIINKTLPSNLQDSCYTLMRGLVEIHNDSFVDESKIDTTNSNYHLFDGKITLP